VGAGGVSGRNSEGMEVGVGEYSAVGVVAGTVNVLPQDLQRALRPANSSGTLKDLEQVGQVNWIILLRVRGKG